MASHLIRLRREIYSGDHWEIYFPCIPWLHAEGAEVFMFITAGILTGT